MNILVKRVAKKEAYTIGKLYIDNKYFCDTLEDRDRGLKQSMPLSEIQKIKVKHQTAIPTGTYEVKWTWSPKYKRMMPLIDNVPGFEGIRIHSGNSQQDTSGCLLLGKNSVVGKVLESRATINKFYPIVSEACKKGKVYITIE